MKVSKEELFHIADLARLNLEDNESESYLANLQDILNFVNILNNAPVENLDITIGANEAKNIFRKDIVETFEDTEILLENSVSKERNMYKLPKIL